MSDGPKIEVIDEPGAGRFVVQVDGTLAGSAYYQRRGDRVVFTHTEIDDVFEGVELAARSPTPLSPTSERTMTSSTVTCSLS